MRRLPGFTPTRSSFANPLRLSELVRPFAIGSGAERIDTGILGIAGKVFLDKQTRRRIPPEFLNSLTLVSGMGVPVRKADTRLACRHIQQLDPPVHLIGRVR